MNITNLNAVCLKTGMETGFFALVKVFTDEGITGIGGQNILWRGWVDYINEMVKPFLIEKIVDPFNVTRFAEYFAFQEAAGMFRINPAPNCIEIALWDIIGKATGQPIYRLLGTHKDKAKAYLSIVPVWKPREMAELTRYYLDKKFRAIKFHSPTGSINEDLKCIRAVRDVAGDEIDIMVDAGQAWKPNPIYNFTRAVKMARGLEKYEAAWFEEPLSHTRHPDLTARLVAAVDIPIAGGGQVFGIHRFKQFIENQILDIIQPDVQNSGGIRESYRIALMAEQYGKLCCPHSGLGPGLTLIQNLQVTGCRNIPYIEYGIPKNSPIHDLEQCIRYRDEILEEPILLDKEGFINFPKKPGLGVALNEEKVAKLTVKAPS